MTVGNIHTAVENENEPDAAWKCCNLPSNQSDKKYSKNMNDNCTKNDYKYELNRFVHFPNVAKV